MSEALERIKDFCFNELDVESFIGGCVTNNITSKKACKTK